MSDPAREVPVANVLEEYRLDNPARSFKFRTFELPRPNAGRAKPKRFGPAGQLAAVGGLFGLSLLLALLSGSALGFVVGLWCCLFYAVSAFLLLRVYWWPGWILWTRLRLAGYDDITYEEAQAIAWRWWRENRPSAPRPLMIPAHDAFLIPGIPANADGVLEIMRMLCDHRAETRKRPSA